MHALRMRNVFVQTRLTKQTVTKQQTVIAAAKSLEKTATTLFFISDIIYGGVAFFAREKANETSP